DPNPKEDLTHRYCLKYYSPEIHKPKPTKSGKLLEYNPEIIAIKDNTSDINTKEEFNRFSGSEAEEEHKEIWKMINYMYRQMCRQKKQMGIISEVLVDHKYHIEALQKKSGISQKSNTLQTKDQWINYLKETVQQLVDTVNKHNQHIEDLEQENKNLKRKLSNLQKDHYQNG
ncbi:23105_t:CDS:1, partial [Racocetra persica]